MTTLTAPTRRDPARAPQRRAVAWVAWRQHRVAIACLLAVLAGYVIAFTIGSLSLHASHPHPRHQDLYCRVPGSYFPCGWAASLGSRAYWSLLALPVLIGLLAGAPLIAREFETGTSRFTRTQGVSARRQVTAALLLLGALVAVVSGVAGLLGHWWADPLTRIGYAGHWTGQVFYGSPVTLPGLSLIALATGVLAGAAIRRTVPAMAATLAACAGGGILLGPLARLVLAIGPVAHRSVPEVYLVGRFSGIRHGVVQWRGVPRAHRHLSRVVGYPSGWPGPHGTWLVSGWFTGPHGQRLGAGAVAALLRKMPLRLLDAARPARVHAWLAARHVTYWIGYQPASRYWLFQAAAGLILLAVAVATGMAAVRLAGRRS